MTLMNLSFLPSMVFAGTLVGSSASQSFRCRYYPNNILECIVTITDSPGASAQASATTTIGNRLPVIQSIDITPNTNLKTDSFGLQAQPVQTLMETHPSFLTLGSLMASTYAGDTLTLTPMMVFRGTLFV